MDSKVQPRMRAVFESQARRALDWRDSSCAERKARVLRLRDAVLAHEEQINVACKVDLGRSDVETRLSETMVIVAECNHALRHLQSWMRPRRIGSNLMFLGTRARVHAVPKGVALIVGPWNVPFNSIFGPLVSALAAGNTAILRPSELSPASSALIREIVEKTFPEGEVAVFEGDAEVAQGLLELPFNHVFFTGSPMVGRSVMEAAAKVHASVTLELGGKSPVVIDQSANMAKTAASIAYGKFQNAGQACIAPDYILIQESKKDAFITAMQEVLSGWYGQTDDERRQTPDFGRIINDRHFHRIRDLLTDAIDKGASVVCGGETDATNRYIAPTLLTDCADGSMILQEEIFGPVLPIITYQELDEAIAYINAREHPLAAYIYSNTKADIQHFRSKTISGDLGVNMCLMHFAHTKLPFGGVGTSGFGKAHAHWGFQAFSHERTELRNLFANFSLIAPPYGNRVRWLSRMILKFLA